MDIMYTVQLPQLRGGVKDKDGSALLLTNR